MNTKIEKLAVFIADNNLQKSDFADQLNVHKSQVSYWLNNNYYIAYNPGTNECALMKPMRRFKLKIFTNTKNTFI